MERKKILIIGMLDSIHLARWLKQFEDEYVDFTLFASKKYKNINSELNKLINSKKSANYFLVWPYNLHFLSGYIDFALNKIGTLLKTNFRKNVLKNVMIKHDFDFVHALEIQGAGYLYSELPKDIIDQNKLILTNWGSDIYYFKDSSEHNSKIAKIVKNAEYYSAECERDFKLVTNYDFQGAFLPCIPNGGGFEKTELEIQTISPSKRNLILCKGYGGEFGLSHLAIPAICSNLRNNTELSAFFYSVTRDVELILCNLKNEFGVRIKYSTVKKPLKREQLMKLFDSARVYIGCSKSDGISTSFLEALVHGAYPIQTNTSCADEWIQKGAIASIVNPSEVEIQNELTSIIFNYDLLNFAAENNIKIANQYLSYEKIKILAKTYYSL